MKILDQYIGKQLISTILLTALALLSVDLFFYLMNEFKFIGKGNYNITQALIFIITMIPRKLYIMFPWSALLGTLLALGQLAKNSELIAMQVSSISTHRITWSVLKAALILTICVVIFGEIIAPVTELIAQQKKTQAMRTGQIIYTEHGLWVRNENKFIHIDTILSNDHLSNITSYRFNEDLSLFSVLHAKNAYSIPEGWKLETITGTKFLNGKTQIFKHSTRILPSLLDQEILKIANVKHLDRLSLRHLWKIIKNRLNNDLGIQTQQVAFWTKVYHPFSILMMVYIGTQFILIPLHSIPISFRIITGIITGFLLNMVNSIAAQLPLIFNLSPIFTIFLVLILFPIIGYIMMSKIR